VQYEEIDFYTNVTNTHVHVLNFCLIGLVLELLHFWSIVGFNCFGLFYLLLSFLAPAECGRFQ